jgi:hypothetical protein
MDSGKQDTIEKWKCAGSPRCCIIYEDAFDEALKLFHDALKSSIEMLVKIQMKLRLRSF